MVPRETNIVLIDRNDVHFKSRKVNSRRFSYDLCGISTM